MFDDVVASLDRYEDIVLAYVFGSLATGQARPDSDVDVAVQAAEPLSAERKMQLIADLASKTGRPVDLIDLSTVGEPLLGQILRHGIRVRGDNARHADLMMRHVLNNEDFMPYVKRMLAERRKAWMG
jgi:uncharacterized protein